MNTGALVFALVFLALGLTFFAQARKRTEAAGIRSARFLAVMFFIAAAAFLIAAAISYFAAD